MSEDLAALRWTFVAGTAGNGAVGLGAAAYAGAGPPVIAGLAVAAIALGWLGLCAVRRAEAARRDLQAANRRLAALSNEDPLLGIANRRRFDDTMDKEWARCCRTRRPIALLMVDIDQFKLYNDLYGHVGGDACLRRCARALRGALRRPADLLSRYGGEEFAVLLPDTDIAGAAHVARELHEAVAAAAICHAGTGTGRITVSIGVAACVPGADAPSHGLIVGADNALYAAKAAGRDRTVVAGGAAESALVAAE